MANEVFYDLTQPDSGMNYRWVQPPQIAYFVTTLDKHGNPNTAPVTLGTCVSVDMNLRECGNYYFTFALGYSDLPLALARQTQQNLAEVPECVISYIGRHLFRETQIASLPLPRGISEIEAMGLTELPSRVVRPPGIQECKVNIELEILSSTKIGAFYMLNVGRAVGVSVDQELVKQDQESELHAGVYALDPWFEFTALAGEGRPPRIHMMRLDPESAQRLPDDIGPSRAFVGTFEDWLQDEVSRGVLTDEDHATILALNEQWQANRDPKFNDEVKRELTRMLAGLLPSREPLTEREAQ